MENLRLTDKLNNNLSLFIFLIDIIIATDFFLAIRTIKCVLFLCIQNQPILTIILFLFLFLIIVMMNIAFFNMKGVYANSFLSPSSSHHHHCLLLPIGTSNIKLSFLLFLPEIAL